jgi:small subunit ribosomal protein S4
MKRITARFKLQRRLGVELPGLGKPGALARKPYPPGQHGNKRKKYSDYALRLEEKQKVRAHYIITEKQLQRFIGQAKQGASSNWTAKLVGNLEKRLDNVVFRLGFAPSILAARQMCSHGHVMVNGKKASTASMVLNQGDKVTLTAKGLGSQNYMQVMDKPRLELADYLRKEGSDSTLTGTVINDPGLEHIPFPFDAGLFTEYYAAKSV